MYRLVFFACLVRAASTGRMQLPSFDVKAIPGSQDAVQESQDQVPSVPEAALASLFLSMGAPKPRISNRRLATSMLDDFVIGTRGSPLALAQAHETRDRLLAAFPDKFRLEEHEPSEEKRLIRIQVIKTLGDTLLDEPLAVEEPVEGVFTRELEIELKEGRVSICVHSMKDVPAQLRSGIVLPCVLEREDTRDVWISSEADSPEDLADGAEVATTSLRRQAQLQMIARKLGKTVRFSNSTGDAQTRIAKVFDKEIHVNNALSSKARFNRMQAHEKELDMKSIRKVLSPQVMLPAIAQGAIGIQCHEADEETLSYLAALNHPDTKAAVDCERSFMRTLDFNHLTPIAGQAMAYGGRLNFKGLVLNPDGSKVEEVEIKGGDSAHAEEIGIEAAREILEVIGDVYEFLGVDKKQLYEQQIQQTKSEKSEKVGQADKVGKVRKSEKSEKDWELYKASLMANPNKLRALLTRSQSQSQSQSSLMAKQGPLE